MYKIKVSTIKHPDKGPEVRFHIWEAGTENGTFVDLEWRNALYIGWSGIKHSLVALWNS